MTSKISFYSLRLENIKHRIGIIVASLFCFFLYILWFLMAVQNICWMRDSTRKEILKNITGLSEPGLTMGIFTVIIAVLLAISGFKYLHSKTEVDFYHSLPVRRRDIFYIILTNDIILFAFPLIVISVFKCVVVAAVGYLSKAFMINTLWEFICYVAVFAVVYLSMTWAMIMTGNTFVGILGFGVLSLYSPAVLRYLYPYLAQTFFKTYCVDSSSGAVFNYFSPASLVDGLLSSVDKWTWGAHRNYFVIICIWIVALLVINYLLFEKRNSEMAGKAMAFPKANPVIRFLLVIPAAVYTGLFLYMVSFTLFKPWIIVGVIVGGFFAHGIIECIYQFDVHGLWSHRKQMLISVAAAFLIIGFFWGDVSGYDNYIPVEEETESIVVESPDIAGSNEGSFWGKERTGVTGETMKGALDILEEVVAQNDKSDKIYSSNSEKSDGYTQYTISYRLKNGEEKKRAYILSPKMQDKLMMQVFNTEEYKKGMYSLYTADWSLVTGVEVSYPAICRDLKMTKEQRAELFRTYLEEFLQLDYETAKTTLPFGQLMIEHKVYDDKYEGIYENGEIDSYYLYPYMKKTIKFLTDELKIDVKTSMKDINISKLELSRYDEETGDVETFVIDDKAFINSIKDKLVYGEYLSFGMSGSAADTSLEIMATVNTENGNDNVMIYTDSKTMKKIKAYQE